MAIEDSNSKFLNSYNRKLTLVVEHENELKNASSRVSTSSKDGLPIVIYSEFEQERDQTVKAKMPEW